MSCLATPRSFWRMAGAWLPAFGAVPPFAPQPNSRSSLAFHSSTRSHQIFLSLIDHSTIVFEIIRPAANENRGTTMHGDETATSILVARTEVRCDFGLPPQDTSCSFRSIHSLSSGAKMIVRDFNNDKRAICIIYFKKFCFQDLLERGLQTHARSDFSRLM